MFRNRLEKVYRHLGRQAKRLGVSCYRLYDHDLPEFPFCIELYEGKVYVAEYKRRHGLSDEEHDAWISKSVEVIADVFNIDRQDIFLKLRKVKEGREGQYKPTLNPSRKPTLNPSRREGLADTLLFENEFVVHENGLKFIVNLADYLDTGLFLDHRITREMVRKESAGKKVLNLFCYTGSFSVYAAAGDAEEVTSVDLSKPYLNRAERNMLLNGFGDQVPLAGRSKYKYVHADVLQYLKKLTENYFDIIILDPPTFSNSQRMSEFLDIQRDHVELINDCLHCLKKEGHLYFSTNFRKFVLAPGKVAVQMLPSASAVTPCVDRAPPFAPGITKNWVLPV